jgi:putative endonuclease
MWYVYILRCNDGSFYTGSTTDIHRRLKEHSSGKGGDYTRTHRPVELVHKETFQDRSSAQKREAQIKKWTRNKKLALINQDSAILKKLGKSRI